MGHWPVKWPNHSPVPHHTCSMVFDFPAGMSPHHVHTFLRISNGGWLDTPRRSYFSSFTQSGRHQEFGKVITSGKNGIYRCTHVRYQSNFRSTYSLRTELLFDFSRVEIRDRHTMSASLKEKYHARHLCHFGCLSRANFSQFEQLESE